MEQHFYLGIDMDENNVIVSFYQLSKKEPETVSTVAGSEHFLIPLCIAKKTGTSQWCVGEEATAAVKEGSAAAAERLLTRALEGETAVLGDENYSYRELLCLFIKKMMFLAGSLQKPVVPDLLVISLESLTREKSELFLSMAPQLGLERGQVTLMDRKESFYYFVYSQKEELYLHDVCLFDYRGKTLICRRMECNRNTAPKLVTLLEEEVDLEAPLTDELFLKIVQTVSKGRAVSTTYLVGDGFDEGWMKESLKYLCRISRVFVGKNLYAKGACYGAAVRAKTAYWPFIYMGASEMKMNVSIRVQNRGKQEFYTLINAGDNWFEKVGECEVILNGTPEVDFWLQAPDHGEAQVEKLELSNFPDRPEKVTRLRIVAKPLSDTQVKVTLKDMGFGELFQSTDRVWEHIMSM